MQKCYIYTADLCSLFVKTQQQFTSDLYELLLNQEKHRFVALRKFSQFFSAILQVLRALIELKYLKCWTATRNTTNILENSAFGRIKFEDTEKTAKLGKGIERSEKDEKFYEKGWKKVEICE